MKWQLSQSIMALLLAVGCGSTFAQDTDLSGRDYAVLSDFLRSQLAGKNGIDDIRVGAKGAVIAASTLVFPKPLDRRERESMMTDLKGITPDTLESFERCSGKHMEVRHRFRLPVEYEVALPEETKDFKLLYSRHPHTNGYVQFSCIGVNSSSSQVLFSVERLMTDSAVGKWILMERDALGNWAVKAELIRWIA
jgi:hypothetical protein